MTVYRFGKDVTRPMKSACTGERLSKRPVVAPVAKIDVKGVTTKGFTTSNRRGGLKRQAIDCQPLLYLLRRHETFSGDTKPGDTGGQGAGGTRYAAPPEAKFVGAPK